MNIEFTPFPQLSTNRLILRRLVMADTDRLRTLRSDSSVNQYLNRPKSMNAEESEAFVNKIDDNLNNNKSLYWVITRANSNDLIGTICLWNFVPEKHTADIGYELIPAYQGQGLMQEAAKKVIDYGFDVIGLKVILGLTHPENKASGNLLKKVGFKPDANYIYVDKENAEGDAVYYLKRG